MEAGRVRENGGKIMKDKFGIGPHGFIALESDTGNMIGLHSMQWCCHHGAFGVISRDIAPYRPPTVHDVSRGRLGAGPLLSGRRGQRRTATAGPVGTRLRESRPSTTMRDDRAGSAGDSSLIALPGEALAHHRNLALNARVESSIACPDCDLL